MPAPIPREARAFTLGLIMGVGGSPYKPREITRLVKERFGVNISPQTIFNWKSNLPKTMETYKITNEYIKEVIDRGLFGDLREQVKPKEPSGEPLGSPQVTPQVTPKEEPKEPESTTQIRPLTFTTAEAVTHLEKQGFIVATSDQDLRDILDKSGLTLLEKGALRYGPEIISVEPIELDFEVVGKQIAGNPVIMWYYALACKLSVIAGEKPPDLLEFVTRSVVDDMVARGWNMAVLRA